MYTYVDDDEEEEEKRRLIFDEGKNRYQWRNNRD